MSNVTSKIEFPRASPEGLIAMAKTLLKTHDANPEAVNVPKEQIEQLREQTAVAEAKKTAAREATELAARLNREADKLLGIGIGQSLSDGNTIVSTIATFRDYAQLAFKKDIEKLRDYGFSVKLSTQAARVSKAMIEKIIKKQ